VQLFPPRWISTRRWSISRRSAMASAAGVPAISNQRLAAASAGADGDPVCPRAPPRDEAPFWDSQAYEFVHLCLYGMGKRYQKPFLQFVSRAGREPVTEAMFQECFGMSYRKMELECAATRNSRPTNISITGPRKAPRAWTSRPRSSCGMPPTPRWDGSRRSAPSRRQCRRRPQTRSLPLHPGSRDPQLLAALGLSELRLRPDRTRAQISGSRRPGQSRAGAGLSRTCPARYARPGPQSADGAGRLSGRTDGRGAAAAPDRPHPTTADARSV